MTTDQKDQSLPGLLERPTAGKYHSKPFLPTKPLSVSLLASACKLQALTIFDQLFNQSPHLYQWRPEKHWGYGWPRDSNSPMKTSALPLWAIQTTSSLQIMSMIKNSKLWDFWVLNVDLQVWKNYSSILSNTLQFTHHFWNSHFLGVIKLKWEFTVRIYQEETLHRIKWLFSVIVIWRRNGKKITHITITLNGDSNQIMITKNHDSKSNDRRSSIPWVECHAFAMQQYSPTTFVPRGYAVEYLSILFGNLVWWEIQKMALVSGFWVYFWQLIMANSCMTEWNCTKLVRFAFHPKIFETIITIFNIFI